MSVVPSIIVLMITALIVFCREITAWPAPRAKQRHGHRTKPSPRLKAPRPPGMTPRAQCRPECLTSTDIPTDDGLVEAEVGAFGGFLQCRLSTGGSHGPMPVTSAAEFVAVGIGNSGRPGTRGRRRRSMARILGINKPHYANALRGHESLSFVVFAAGARVPCGYDKRPRRLSAKV
jgi:hypothetical protein